MSFLTWADLTEGQLTDIFTLRDKRPNAPTTCREALAVAVGLRDKQKRRSVATASSAGGGGAGAVGEQEASSHDSEAAVALRDEIELDLLMDTLELCQSLQFNAAKTSTFFSLVKRLHSRSVQERLPVDRAFSAAKDMLLQHSVHRPPYSIAVFTLADTHKLADWLLEHYFRHYKLYQYTFAPRVKVNVSSRHPSDVVEKAPMLPPLEEAITEEEDMKRREEEAAAAEAERVAAEEAAAAQAEKEREERIHAEYLSAIPDELKTIVHESLEAQLGSLRTEMGEQFKAQEEQLLAKIKQLEVKVGK